MITFENALEVVSQLPREQQEYRTGNLKAMSAEEVISELRCYLESDEDS
jgi:hypothetical protein